jgi:NET1-associated nuclear protein 1 (U3 small nucleolar RNA-associated protein 17)
LLSTLSPPAVTGEGKISRPRVSVLLLNPANPLQLIVGSLDGMLRIWDYVEGRLLRTLEVGGAVLYACGHESLGDQLFVALAAEDDAVSKKARQDDKKAAPMAGIYSISLKPRSVPGSPSSLSPSHPRSPARRMRLAHPRPLTSLSLSPSGSYLISVNPNTINLCRTSHLSRGFARHVETKEAMTTLAFHPTEDYFATGEVGGRIRLWYGILSSSEEWEVSSKTPSTTRTAELTTSVFHWHTTPVSSLVFTPNGGYLLSAGGESVIVLWQLHTGHQEYVPRLGGAVETLSITEDPGVEQVVAARMADGSVVFVGMGKLNVLRSIKGLKTGEFQLYE